MYLDLEKVNVFTRYKYLLFFALWHGFWDYLCDNYFLLCSKSVVDFFFNLKHISFSYDKKLNLWFSVVFLTKKIVCIKMFL
jgi:hypothetical protein